MDVRLPDVVPFSWSNGSFSSVQGNPVIDAAGVTTAFPDDFRMISGDMTLRSFDPSNFAQQAVTFLCLNFNGKSTRTNELPKGQCASGIRSQINFPSCWDGRNVDSPDHKSHVAFLSTGPDNGTCSDPHFPITLPRIFMEVYWVTQVFDSVHSPTATQSDTHTTQACLDYEFRRLLHFYNGWDDGALQRALDGCRCNPFGDPSCCAAQGIFDIKQEKRCFISDTVAEQTLGLLPALPGNNPIQAHCYEQYFDAVTPPLYDPVFVHTNTLVTAPPPTGTIATPAQTALVTQLARGTCIANAVDKVQIGVWWLAVTSSLSMCLLL
ncbi:hypothetical protein D9619_008944 [Psilocybe cf. subviscida]|uniref:DUF1996 domain-containing protein n=1 Tax=Psilocybe cf. subviscida TaxID=2480587 RepID=A0A8H5BU98_9AGAR|nr:hypothetical protein D9619_008944 [Psilocybe cf. subviscida]